MLLWHPTNDKRLKMIPFLSKGVPLIKWNKILNTIKQVAMPSSNCTLISSPCGSLLIVSTHNYVYTAATRAKLKNPVSIGLKRSTFDL